MIKLIKQKIQTIKRNKYESFNAKVGTLIEPMNATRWRKRFPRTAIASLNPNTSLFSTLDIARTLESKGLLKVVYVNERDWFAYRNEFKNLELHRNFQEIKNALSIALKLK